MNELVIQGLFIKKNKGFFFFLHQGIKTHLGDNFFSFLFFFTQNALGTFNKGLFRIHPRIRYYYVKKKKKTLIIPSQNRKA